MFEEAIFSEKSIILKTKSATQFCQKERSFKYLQLATSVKAPYWDH
jgi:hypothetical protein